MTRRGIIVFVVGSLMVLPLAALARSAPTSTSSKLTTPHVSITRALSLAHSDVNQHGSLVGSGFISSVEYGRFQQLSSGARVPGTKTTTRVWAITYTDTSGASARARQIIDATTGKVLTRVYYSK